MGILPGARDIGPSMRDLPFGGIPAPRISSLQSILQFCLHNLDSYDYSFPFSERFKCARIASHPELLNTSLAPAMSSVSSSLGSRCSPC
jgi:hypothetical protein